MASNLITDGQITASSEHDSDRSAVKARLDNQPGAWASVVVDQNQWIQVRDE